MATPFGCYKPYKEEYPDTIIGQRQKRYDMVNSCKKNTIGPYYSKQRCMDDCMDGRSGLAKTRAEAAEVLQARVRGVLSRKASSKKITTSELQPGKGSRMARRSGKLPKKKSKKKPPSAKGSKKKVGCPTNTRSSCTSPCKWASGKKRSFCRREKNRPQREREYETL